MNERHWKMLKQHCWVHLSGSGQPVNMSVGRLVAVSIVHCARQRTFLRSILVPLFALRGAQQTFDILQLNAAAILWIFHWWWACVSSLHIQTTINREKKTPHHTLHSTSRTRSGAEQKTCERKFRVGCWCCDGFSTFVWWILRVGWQFHVRLDARFAISTLRCCSLQKK